MEAQRNTGLKSLWGRYYPYIFCTFAFLFFRVFALSFQYHQDEYKWARAVGFEPFFSPSIPHPPLARALYVVVSTIFGNDYLRLMPLTLSFATLILLMYFLSKNFGKVEAVIGGILFAIIPYSVIASLQIDIDGAVLPLFAMLAIMFYLALARTNFKDKKLWLPLILSIIFGFLSKLSFVIVVASIFSHFVYERYISQATEEGRKKAQKFIWYTVGACAILLPVFLWLENHVYIFSYVKKFTDIKQRNFGQLLFQSLKAIIYLSPLLILPVFASIKNFKKLSVWYFLLIYSLLFYTVLFDFTRGALDRYLMVLILPSVIIGADFLAEKIRGYKKIDWMIAMLIFSSAVFARAYMSIISHVEIPLNPKSAFLHALRAFHLNILLPMSGGSGPLGFYISLLFISVFTLLIFLAFVFFFAFRGEDRKKLALSVFIAFGCVYALNISSEYAFGVNYGSSSYVLDNLLAYTMSHDEIKEVITYNDAGAYTLINGGKYLKRFYPDPAFVEDNKQKLKDYKGYYLVLDFPELNKDSVYAKYFATCREAYESSDKNMNGSILDCSKADNSIFN